MKIFKLCLVIGLSLNVSFGSPLPPQPECLIKARVHNDQKIRSNIVVHIEILEFSGKSCTSYKDKLLKNVLVDNGNPKKGDVIEARIQFSGDEFGSGYRILEWNKKP